MASRSAQALTAPSNHLAANLAAHTAKWGFAPSLGVGEPTARVEPNAGPWPRITLRAEDDRWLAVHSERQPLDEAAAWVAQACPTAGTVELVCVIGAGAGYVLDVLRERLAANAKILVLEPDAHLLRVCLERRDWTDLVSSGRLMFLAGPAFEGRAHAWRLVGPRTDSHAMLVHPIIGRARGVESKEAARAIAQALAGADANQRARERFAAPYLLNALRNLPRFATARDVRALRNHHAGLPAIVAAAGPSLNENLESLARIEGWRERAVVIAVDTALKPMIAAGMTPHYVVGVDPGEANARTLTGLPSLPDTCLVAEASLDPRCFASFEDRSFVFSVSDTHQPWPWLRSLGVDIGRLRAWGSVLTTSYDLALELGCGPVVLIGADLAYTKGQPYCRGTVYEEYWAAAVARGLSLEEVWRLQLPKADLLTLPDVHGRDVQTSKTLVAFRDWLAAQAAEDRTHRVVNATNGGLLSGPGIEQNTLASVLERAPRMLALSGVAAPLDAPAVSDAATLERAARAAVHAATAPRPTPIGEWIDFTAGRTTCVELATTVTGAFADTLGRDPSVELALKTHADVTAAETAAWTSRAEADARELVDGPWHWRPASPGDWCLGPTASALVPSGPLADFRTFHALGLAGRRLEHLATLGLPLRQRTVLEVGAGVGDLTEFFLGRACQVHTTDARPELVTFLRRRFSSHPLVTADYLNLDPPPSAMPTLFDVVFCYGTLYHVSDPAAALEFLSRACGDLFLLDTLVGPDDATGENPVPEDPSIVGSAVSGRGTRPARAWVWARLRELFAHVYVPTTQPNHYEYPVDWHATSPFSRRAIFVASRRALVCPSLSDVLVDRQARH